MGLKRMSTYSAFLSIAEAASDFRKAFTGLCLLVDALGNGGQLLFSSPFKFRYVYMKRAECRPDADIQSVAKKLNLQNSMDAAIPP